MKRRLLLLFFVGAIIGTVLDSFHIQGGAAYYSKPMALGVSWWTPLILGLATVVIGFTHFKIHPFVPRIKWGLPVSLLCFFVSYWVSAFLPATNFEKTFLISGLYFLGWGLFDKTRASLVLAFLTAIIGCGIEGVLGYVEFFVYTKPDYFYVPLWLLPLYANTSAACGNLGRLLLQKNDG